MEVKISKLDVEEGDEAFVYHVDDNDKIEDMEGKVNKEGDVVFDTTHFSEYAVLADSYVYGLGSWEWYNIDQYNTMLQDMEDKVEVSTATNIPITSWKRTPDNQSVQVKKVNQGDVNDWTWTDVLKMDLSVIQENRVWDGSRLDNSGNVIIIILQKTIWTIMLLQLQMIHYMILPHGHLMITRIEMMMLLFTVSEESSILAILIHQSLPLQ